MIPSIVPVLRPDVPLDDDEEEGTDVPLNGAEAEGAVVPRLVSKILIKIIQNESRNSPVAIGITAPDLVVAKPPPPAVVVEATTAVFMTNPAAEQYPAYTLEAEVKSPTESPIVQRDKTHLLRALTA